MVMPPTVLGYCLLMVIGSQGVVGAWLLEPFGIRLIFTWQAGVIAATIVSFPLVFKAAYAAFETVGPQLEVRIAVHEAVQAEQDDTANFLLAITSIPCIAVLLSAGRPMPGRVLACG